MKKTTEKIIQLTAKVKHEDGYEYSLILKAQMGGILYTMEDNRGSNDTEFTPEKDVQKALREAIPSLKTLPGIISLKALLA